MRARVRTRQVLEGVAGDAVAPVQLGGIYLPLDTPSEACFNDPLLLAYWNGHFVPLITEEEPRTDGGWNGHERPRECVPVAWQNGEEFAVRFHSADVDPPEGECMRKYLDIVSQPFPEGARAHTQTHRHGRTHACALTRKHARVHEHTSTCTHTYIHSRGHAHGTHTARTPNNHAVHVKQQSRYTSCSW